MVMPLPITPTSEGGGETFLKRVAAFAHALPDIFVRLDKHKMHAAYRGVDRSEEHTSELQSH